jgi:hypothetical protein
MPSPDPAVSVSVALEDAPTLIVVPSGGALGNTTVALVIECTAVSISIALYVAKRVNDCPLEEGGVG